MFPSVLSKLGNLHFLIVWTYLLRCTHRPQSDWGSFCFLSGFTLFWYSSVALERISIVYHMYWTVTMGIRWMNDKYRYAMQDQTAYFRIFLAKSPVISKMIFLPTQKHGNLHFTTCTRSLASDHPFPLPHSHSYPQSTNPYAPASSSYFPKLTRNAWWCSRKKSKA